MPTYNVIIGDAVGREDEPPWEPETPRETKMDETPCHAATDEPWTSPLQGNEQVENNVIEKVESFVKKSEALPANGIFDNDHFPGRILPQKQTLGMQAMRKKQWDQLVYRQVFRRICPPCRPRHRPTGI